MNLLLHKKDLYYYVILWTQIVMIIDMLQYLFKINDNILISIIQYLLMIGSTILLIYLTISKHKNIDFFKGLLIIWIIYLIISSLPSLTNDYRNFIILKRFLTNSLFLFLIPMFMVSDLDEFFFKKLFKLCYMLLFAYLLMAIPIYIFGSVTDSYSSEYFTNILGGAIILTMTMSYHNNKKNRIIIISIIIAIIIMMLLGRRNVVIYFGGGLFLAALLNIIGRSTMRSKKKVGYIFVVTGIAFLFGLMIFSSSFSFFFERMNEGMSSREGIIELFKDDFNSHKSDWIWGRGIFGQFEGGYLSTDKNTGLRDGIENGYLMLILKGGWIWLGLLIIISIKAIYLGLFKSNNKLCKGFALIIILYYVDMIGFGIPMITIKYIMIFVGISACTTKWLRECDDQHLSDIIGLK